MMDDTGSIEIMSDNCIELMSSAIHSSFLIVCMIKCHLENDETRLVFYRKQEHINSNASCVRQSCHIAAGFIYS